ncbi:MAG TPA: hypothetical protein VLM85_06475 [Polyangiaceae bacterium]|nr:hypothetical protein [Polyangiaceae bacterium]
MDPRPSRTAVALTVILLVSALSPASFVDSVPEIDLTLVWLCSGKALRPREDMALAVIALACIALIVARAVTHEYFVTPMAMWHAGRALLGA